MSKNQLRVIPVDIGLLTQLQILILDENQLESLPPEINKLTKLKYLSLVGNPLTEQARTDVTKWLPKCIIHFEASRANKT